MNSWSLSGYDTQTIPSRIPNMITDIVRIGNGKKITLIDDGLNPKVRSVFVEKYKNLPGQLQINGQFNYLRGFSFYLNVSCTLGLQHIDGIRAIN